MAYQFEDVGVRLRPPRSAGGSERNRDQDNNFATRHDDLSLRKFFPYRDIETLEYVLDGLIKAGLPE